MKKVVFILASVLFLSFTNATSSSDLGKEQSRTVYVCGKSDIYHTSSSHSALTRCKSGIKEMSESDAKKLGKRACKCRN